MPHIIDHPYKKGTLYSTGFPQRSDGLPWSAVNPVGDDSQEVFLDWLLGTRPPQNSKFNLALRSQHNYPKHFHNVTREYKLKLPTTFQSKFRRYGSAILDRGELPY